MTERKNQITLNGTKYSVIILKEENDIKFLLHNAKVLFIEELTSKEFENKARLCNPELEDLDSDSLLDEIMQTFCGSVDSKIDILANSEEELILNFKFDSDGIPLIWKFEFRKGSQQELYDHVTSKILNVVDLLLGDRAQLFKIIHDKDLELSEYKKSGLKLSRKDLATKEFVPGEYSANYTAKLSNRTCDEILMSSEVQTYIDTVQKLEKSMKEPTLQHVDQSEKRTKKSKLIEEQMNMQKKLVSQTPSTNIVKRKISKDEILKANKKAALSKKLQRL